MQKPTAGFVTNRKLDFFVSNFLLKPKKFSDHFFLDINSTQQYFKIFLVIQNDYLKLVETVITMNGNKTSLSQYVCSDKLNSFLFLPIVLTACLWSSLRTLICPSSPALTNSDELALAARHVHEQPRPAT